MFDSPQGIFFGIQPILDHNQRIVAYELRLKPDLSIDANLEPDSQTSTRAMIQAFDELGIAGALGEKKGYIRIGAELLLSDLIESLPSSQVVIELLETIPVDERIINRCRELKTMGFSLALGNCRDDTQFEPLFELMDVIKIDQPAIPEEHVQHLKRWPVKLLAGKVENTAQAIQYRDLGFDLLQGYSFAHPVELHAEHADTSKLELMKLLELVLADAETHEIEQAFRRDPSLVYNLLRMVNSASGGGRYKVGSLKQAITILGRQQIRRWLQLLLFAGRCGDMQTPLLELAATRGKMMELLAISHSRMDRDFHDRAFMTGIMSLLDTLLGIPMEEVVNQVSLAGDIEGALLNHEGKLGTLLLLVEKMEQYDFDAAEGLLADMQLKLSNLTLAQIEAMRWANKLNETTEY